MAPTAPYPRSTLRTALRAHAATPKPAQLSPNIDAVAFVAWLAHLRRLAREVRAEAAQGGSGKKRVGRREVKRASKRLLEQLDG
ncbi:hypothetical protein JCM10213_000910 [Rhodosporidiobolus nylandii]